VCRYFHSGWTAWGATRLGAGCAVVHAARTRLPDEATTTHQPPTHLSSLLPVRPCPSSSLTPLVPSASPRQAPTRPAAPLAGIMPCERDRARLLCFALILHKLDDQRLAYPPSTLFLPRAARTRAHACSLSFGDHEMVLDSGVVFGFSL
jgi:hypothetical protein